MSAQTFKPVYDECAQKTHAYARDKGKGEGQVLIALLHDEHMLRSALQSRKWQLIG